MPFIYDLDTPVLLVHEGRLQRNIQQIQAIVDAAGVKLRPHIKTHKCRAIAARQIAAGAKGLTCAKLSEAEAMEGISDDLFVAYPIVGPHKFERLDRLAERNRIRISVESEQGAELLETHLKPMGRIQDVMVKLDTGLGRTGIHPTDCEPFFRKLAAMPHLHVVGLFTHEGMAYGITGEEHIRPLLDSVAVLLHQAESVFTSVFGYPPELSPGCTLTAPLVTSRHGFTEIRPGAYVFKDIYCSESGIYPETECALDVLVTVVAVKEDNRVIIDGGSKTFALDRHPVVGNGRAIDRPDLSVIRLTEEHGILKTDRPGDYRVGQMLRIIPAHVCPVVNLHSYLYVHDGERVLEKLPIEARGCVT